MCYHTEEKEKQKMKKIKRLVTFVILSAVLVFGCTVMAGCGTDPAAEGTWYIEKVRKDGNEYTPWVEYYDEEGETTVFWSDSWVWTFDNGKVEVKDIQGNVVKGTYSAKKKDSSTTNVVTVNLENGQYYEGYCVYYSIDGGKYIFMLENEEMQFWLENEKKWSYEDYLKGQPENDTETESSSAENLSGNLSGN